MSFPTHRPRRLRRTEALRSMVRETRLTTAGLIYPMFVCPGKNVRQEVGSMPNIFQQSADQIVEESREVESLGIPAVILFGLPETKDPRGASSLSSQGVVQQAIEGIRKANLKLLVITDVCLCEYTDHGHCGVIEHGEVANDRFASCSTSTSSRMSQFFPTPQNTAPDFTGRFAKPRSPRRSSATAAATRWIPRTRARR